MRIRTKLTALLVTFAVGPLLAVNLYGLARTRELGRDLAERTGLEQRQRTSEAFEAVLRESARTVGARRTIVEVAVSTLAAEVALRSQASADVLQREIAPEWATPGDFSNAATAPSDAALMPGRYPATGETEGSAGTALVSLREAVLAPDAGASEADVELAGRRLARVREGLRRMLAATGETPLFLSVWTEGATARIPGSGHGPGHADEAAWRALVGAASGPVWSAPYRHAGTGDVVVTCSVRATDDAGRVVGLAWADVRVTDLAGVRPPGATVDSAVMVLAGTDQGAEAWAVSGSGAGGQPVRPAALSEARLATPGAFEAEYAGKPSVWLHHPVGPGVALAFVVAKDVLEARAQIAAEEVYSRTSSQLRVTFVTAGVVFLAAVGVAYMAARTVTRPIRELAALADRLAGGDLTVRAAVRGRDEVARLATDLNRMIPRLAASVRIRESEALTEELHAGRRGVSPDWPGLDVHGLSVPCAESKGDYFEYFDLTRARHGCYALAIGDVSGHGPGAALLVMAMRTLLASRVDEVADPGRLVQGVNHQLASERREGRFVSLLYVEFDRVNARVSWVNAGHEPGLLYAPERDEFSGLDAVGLPLGVDTATRYETRRLAMPPAGTVMFLGTDGVVGTRNAAGERFGRERLHAAIRTHHAEPAAAIAEHVRGAVDAFRGDAALADDLTLVVVRVR